MKKIIIPLIIVIGGLVLIMPKDNNIELAPTKFGDKVNTDNIIGKKYDTPIIKEVIYENNNIEVIAGRYVYGDINRDGIINDLDIKTMMYIINSYFTYTVDQKELADLNQNGIVNENDVIELQNYLNNKSDYTYQYLDKEIMYAISNKQVKTNLSWQESNNFNIYNEGVYYVFIKDKYKIYEPFEFNYIIYDEEDE